MTSHPEREVKSQAELLRDLLEGGPEIQVRALARLAQIGDADALDGVIDYLTRQAGDVSGGSLKTLNVLAHKYTPASRYELAEVLLPVLGSENWQQRQIAVRLLNAHPSEMAIDALRELIADAREKLEVEQRRRFSPIRMNVERTLNEAILALANCGRLLALPDVLDLLEDPVLRIMATRALGMIGSDTERLRLEELAEDYDPRVRDSAQWSLGLMDERLEQFLNPPDEMPDPPPDRLHPLYWAHRQLVADDDSLNQFLVVRVAVEHIILDEFISEGRGLEECTVVLRSYAGDQPPDFRTGEGDLVGAWRYTWEGPALTRLAEVPPPPAIVGISGAQWHGPQIIIAMPETLLVTGNGLVSLDALFDPRYGHGGLYHITQDRGEWSFLLRRRTWAT